MQLAEEGRVLVPNMLSFTVLSSGCKNPKLHNSVVGTLKMHQRSAPEQRCHSATWRQDGPMRPEPKD